MQPKEFITTYKKHRFSPLDPRPGDIDIEDIAHALSLICRANGHFERFFSVSQHCVNCCKEGIARGESPRVLLMLLLHDAAEAYISDLTRPVKIGLPNYVKIEERLQSVIWEKFGIIPSASRVNEIDNCPKTMVNGIDIAEKGVNSIDNEMKIVNEIDDMMLFLEFKHFAGEEIIFTSSSNFPPDYFLNYPLISPDFSAKSFEKSESEFLELFRTYWQFS